MLSAIPRLRRPLDGPIIAKSQSDVVLDCDVINQEDSSIKWLKNSEVVVTSDYFLVENSGQRLRILGLLPSDSGLYQCVVSNDAGVIQSAATLTVLPLGLIIYSHLTFYTTKDTQSPNNYQKIPKINIDHLELRHQNHAASLSTSVVSTKCKLSFT